MKLLWAVATAAFLSGCGYIGDPMYPLLNIPAPVKDLSATQRGSLVIFQFNLPKLTTEGKQARIGQVEIRIGESGPGEFNLNRWYEHSVLVEAAADENGHVRAELPAGPWVGKNITLGAKVFGPNRRDAGWSNLVEVTVVTPLAKPAAVNAVAVAEGVRVTWQVASTDSTQYKVFRKEGEAPDSSALATVDTNAWVDTATEYGKHYLYTVQAVGKAGAGMAESDLSDPAEVTPSDKFSPAVPVGLNAIAAVDHIELVWDRSTESDSAGYRVYRAPAGGAFEKIADLSESPSYSDRKLEPGKPYRYAVSAVDRSGNESRQSEPVEIIAP